MKAKLAELAWEAAKAAVVAAATHAGTDVAVRTIERLTRKPEPPAKSRKRK